MNNRLETLKKRVDYHEATNYNALRGSGVKDFESYARWFLPRSSFEGLEAQIRMWHAAKYGAPK